MVPHVGRRLLAARAAIALAILALLAPLAGCGSSGGATAASVTAASVPARSCPETAMEALRNIVRYVYRLGGKSERTEVARRTIAGAAALRTAVEGANAPAAQAAAQALIAAGHMTNLRVIAHGRVLADAGGPAVAPITGQLKSASGAVIGEYVTSVWSDEGLLAEASGITQGRVALRVGGHSVGGSLPLAPGRLPPEGAITIGHVRYQYASFGGHVYPSGGPLRVYVFRPLSSIRGLCGASSEDTLVNTVSHVADLIYAGEGGRRAQVQVKRVQADPALRAAVAHRDPVAAKAAADALLNQHIVRLRVALPGGRVLIDDGGPYVLAPVGGTLRQGGRTLARFELSIQDDEGYLRLTKRLVGLRVLMYMNTPRPTLVKNSLGPSPGTVPTSGRYTYRGSTYHVYTLHAAAFPSGPLTVRVLIPIPYP
jgi:hypothetical protein